MGKASQGKVEFIRTSYLREGYIFECGNLLYFDRLMSKVSEAETVEDAICSVKDVTIDGKPLCKRIFKVEEVL